MASMTLQNAFALAQEHLSTGSLAQAESIYRQILSQQNDHPDALHMLGLIAYQTQRTEAAAELIRRAIGVESKAEYYANYGLVLAALGKRQQAIEAYQTALSCKPQFPEAMNNLANMFLESRQLREAVDLYQGALRLLPKFAKALNGLGNAYQIAGQLDEAINSYRQAICIEPHSAAIQNNLGNALYLTGQWDLAIESYERARELQPNYPDVHYNLGNALQMKGQTQQAISAYRQALALRPNYPEAQNNLGNALRRDRRFDDAIDCYRSAIALRPNFVDAHNNLATAFKDLGELDDAIAGFDQALGFQPDNVAIASNRLYTLYFHSGFDPAAILKEHEQWNQRFAAKSRPSAPSYDNDRSENRRIKIGYASPDFRDHVVGQNLLPLLREHDHQQFEIFCYANVQKPDMITEKFQSYADQWRNLVGKNDEQAAEMIRADQIDILVDLSLHMANNRMLVFARKPAPIQVTFGGYPGTTGLRTIDYRLTDRFLDPPEIGAPFYTEETVRLPHSFWCYDPGSMDVADAPLPGPLPALSSGSITFGCLNNFCKVNDHVLQLWGQTLQAIENSRLLMLAPPGRPRRRVLDQLKNHGVDESRVEFVELQPRKSYLATYQRIDMGLDTFPYNGHTTSLDSLWMGVPVISLIGQTVVGRAGWSQMSNLDLTEFAAHSWPQFVDIAVKWSADLQLLSNLRATLRGRMQRSPLTNCKVFARDVEAAYREMWSRWRSSR
ncbi:MAG: tetratricopeptide repeat protein [Planctomycetota bacterium]|nr:tetratricopeptide repeat protein [Planctomycetota bacterium]